MCKIALSCDFKIDIPLVKNIIKVKSKKIRWSLYKKINFKFLVKKESQGIKS